MEWMNFLNAGLCLGTGLVVGFSIGKAWGISLGWSRGYQAAKAFYALKIRERPNQTNSRL